MPLEDQKYKISNFTNFIHSFENTLKSAFHVSSDINEFSLERGIPPHVLQEIMNKVPLSVAIPAQYGGRGAIVKECLGLLAAASYESLPLSLTFGINIALFLEPVAKYGNENVKQGIFQKFLCSQIKCFVMPLMNMAGKSALLQAILAKSAPLLIRDDMLSTGA